MRRISIGFVVGVASFAQTAFAADFGLYEAPPPVFSWTGAYIGGYVGGAGEYGAYSTPDSACQTGAGGCNGGPVQIFFQGAGSIPAAYDLSDSAIGGIAAGFNWQMGKAVFGLESETGYIHMSGSGQFLTNGNFFCNPAAPLAPPCSNYMASSTLGNWYTAVAVRVGITGEYLFRGWTWADRTLLYLKAAPALTRFSTGVNSTNYPGNNFAVINFSTAQNVWGAAAGTGVEWAFAQNWSVKAEYEYLSFDHTTQACGLATTPSGVAIPNAPYCTSTAMHGVQTGKIGLNWKFSDRVWPF